MRADGDTEPSNAIALTLPTIRSGCAQTQARWLPTLMAIPGLTLVGGSAAQWQNMQQR
jgi:hypothetical protein